MGDTSSDDELPLAQRPLGGILMAARQPVGPASDTESDIPSWLQAGAKGKSNQVVNLTDSDSDDAVLSPAKAAPAAAAAAEPAGNRGQQQQPASQQQQQQQAAAKAAPKSGSKPKATPRGRAAAAAEPAGPDDGGDPPATQAAPASQPATAGGTSQKQRTLAAGLLQAPTSQMAVVLPDKLPQLKMLVELELSADDTHGVTDLSGDSGAIGRLTMGGTKEDPQMQIDLKGVLYSATIVPLPVSIAVINMGLTEAKVECLFSEFVQLREDTRFSFIDSEKLGALVGGDDDDDNYTYAGGDEGGEGGDAAAKKGRGKAAAGGGGKAAAAAGGKAAPRKRAPAKAKGGVKKGGGKPRAKPKPRAGSKKK